MIGFLVFSHIPPFLSLCLEILETTIASIKKLIAALDVPCELRAPEDSEMTIHPARHECHACCPLQAEKPGIQPIVGSTHGTNVEQVVSSFQKILRGSQLTWYF